MRGGQRGSCGESTTVVTDTTKVKGPASLPLEIGPLDVDGPLSLHLATPLRLPRRVDLAFGSLLVGEGWHDCESADGVPFRWMGREDTASIWLAVDRSVDLVVDIGILLMIDPSFGDRIVIEVGEPGQAMRHERTHEGVSFILPHAPGPVMPTKIELRAPALVKEPDTRRLSIACFHVRTRPLDQGLTETTRLTLTMELSRRLGQGDTIAQLAARQDRQGSGDVG